MSSIILKFMENCLNEIAHKRHYHTKMLGSFVYRSLSSISDVINSGMSLQKLLKSKLCKFIDCHSLKGRFDFDVFVKSSCIANTLIIRSECMRTVLTVLVFCLNYCDSHFRNKELFLRFLYRATLR